MTPARPAAPALSVRATTGHVMRRRCGEGRVEGIERFPVSIPDQRGGKAGTSVT